MKRYTLSFAAGTSYPHPALDCTAKRGHGGMDFDQTYQVWPSRAAMAMSVRMQEKRAPRYNDWHPLVPLSPGEGH